MIDPGSLLYVAQGVSNAGSWMAFIFDARNWTGDLRPEDPDGFILDARFLTVVDAIERLEAVPWQSMREPIVEYLREPYPHGTLWSYRDDRNGNSELVDRSPPFAVNASESM